MISELQKNIIINTIMPFHPVRIGIFGVELSEIWSTVINDIPILKNQIQKIIEDIENACTT